ncbi:MAG: hypothetical protein AAF531_14535 [Actinomycetota bacterium]
MASALLIAACGSGGTGDAAAADYPLGNRQSDNLQSGTPQSGNPGPDGSMSGSADPGNPDAPNAPIVEAVPADDGDSIRSSGALAFADPDDETVATAQPRNPDASSLGADEAGSSSSTDQVPSTTDQPVQGPPTTRPDGIELVFADGLLAAIQPGSTIEEIGRTLGPLYIITPEPFIREGFPGGYSVAQTGEVLFWAIEENGRITTIMATNPRVGLDSGLRPTMPLVDAIALHGEPSLSLGAQLREFAVFADGVGSEDGVQVLVDIGQFGGPVGTYPGAPQPGAVANGFQLGDAVVKELWFTLPPAGPDQPASVESS